VDAILKVRNLKVTFDKKGTQYNAVDDVSLDVFSGKATCLMGENGSGKSLTALSILNLTLLGGHISGEVEFNGISLNSDNISTVRGREIFSIFQNPEISFNTNTKIGVQLFQLAKSHGAKNKIRFEQQMQILLRKLNIENNGILKKYPFELSKGMLQRIMIGYGIWVKPKLIIADEPTSSLGEADKDAVLRLFEDTMYRLGTGILLITHQFEFAARLANYVVIMKEGKIVEKGAHLLSNPQSEYTKRFVNAAKGQ